MERIADLFEYFLCSATFYFCISGVKALVDLLYDIIIGYHKK